MKTMISVIVGVLLLIGISGCDQDPESEPSARMIPAGNENTIGPDYHNSGDPAGEESSEYAPQQPIQNTGVTVLNNQQETGETAPPEDEYAVPEIGEATPEEDEADSSSDSPEESDSKIVLLIPGTLITGDYFDVMYERLLADGFKPIIYEPEDLLTESLVQGAEGIATVVQQVLESNNAKKLDIIAECNGGVATRYYLQFLGGHASVNRVITMVSAHHGTYKSPLGYWFSGYESLAEITPGSEFLNKLNGVPLPTETTFVSIYTCWDEFMKPYQTSEIDGAYNVLFCDHYIGHFDVFWDDLVYSSIHAALQDNILGIGNHF